MRFMTTPGQLVAATALALGLPEGSVAHPWRVLREAGEVTVGGRGRHAAHVTMEDAAKLFIAVAAESPSKNTLESSREFAQLKALPQRPRRPEPGEPPGMLKYPLKILKKMPKLRTQLK